MQRGTQSVYLLIYFYLFIYFLFFNIVKDIYLHIYLIFNYFSNFFVSVSNPSRALHATSGQTHTMPRLIFTNHIFILFGRILSFLFCFTGHNFVHTPFLCNYESNDSETEGVYLLFCTSVSFISKIQTIVVGISQGRAI